MLENAISALCLFRTKREDFVNGETWRFLPVDIRVGHLRRLVDRDNDAPDSFFSRFGRPILGIELRRLHIEDRPLERNIVIERL